MLIAEKNTAEIKKWGLRYGDTVSSQYLDLYFPEEQVFIDVGVVNFEDAKTKYPKLEENLTIEKRLDLYSFAQSLFPEGRLFTKEEQVIFKKIRDEISKDF